MFMPVPLANARRNTPRAMGFLRPAHAAVGPRSGTHLTCRKDPEGSFRQRQRPASPDWLPRSGGRLPRSDDYSPPVDAATDPPTTIATLRMDFLIAMSCSASEMLHRRRQS